MNQYKSNTPAVFWNVLAAIIAISIGSALVECFLMADNEHANVFTAFTKIEKK